MKKQSIIEDLFSANKSGVWKDFEADLNAKHIDQGFFKEDKLIINQNGWLLIMDVYLSDPSLWIPFTRVTAICKELQPFNLKIKSRKKYFNPCFNSIKLDNNEINKRYCIKSYFRKKAKEILNEEGISDLLKDLDSLKLRFDKSGSVFIDGVLYPQLQHIERGYIRDVDKLKKLTTLFNVLLDSLENKRIIEKIEYNP